MARVLTYILLWMSLSSCWMTRAYSVRKMQPGDWKRLSYVRIRPSETPFPFTDATGNPENKALASALDSELRNTGTSAFLVIRHDSILYERYAPGLDAATLLPSNSVAKSFVSTLAGIAIREGTFRSLNDPITDYLPELVSRDPRFKAITLQHLLDMRSGLDFREGSYDLHDDGVRLGFRPDLEKHILRVRIAEPPGRFRYQSVNTMLVGLAIRRASGKSLAAYLEEKLWAPIGAESGATWNVDNRRRKIEIGSAAINATARDFAKLGRLMLRDETPDGKALLPPDWIRSFAPTDTMSRYGGYRMQWWGLRATKNFTDPVAAERFCRNQSAGTTALIARGDGSYDVKYRTCAFNARGFRNQIIYVNPCQDLLILRFGQGWTHPQGFTNYIYNLGERLSTPGDETPSTQEPDALTRF